MHLRIQIGFENLARKKPVQEVLSIRAMVVEDFLPCREFVCSKLRQVPGLQVICEVADGLEAVQKAEALQPDLILLDIGLPTLNGLEVAQRLHELAPKSKIIFLSQETSPELVQHALALGASGYVFKTQAESDLMMAIEDVMSGKRFVPSA